MAISIGGFMKNPDAYPILGTSIALGGPFIVSALSKIINPELPLPWPLNVINAFAFKMLPYLLKLALITLVFFLTYKGVLTLIKKINLGFEKERNKLRDTLIFRQEDFERRLASYIKEDRKKREEDFANLEKKIIKILEELKSPSMHVSTETSENTVFKNFA